MKNLRVLLVISFQELQTVTFERQHQYTAHLVNSRLIKAKFVGYNDQAPPPLCLPDITHVTLSPRPSPLFLPLQTRGGNGLGTRLLYHLCINYHFGSLRQSRSQTTFFWCVQKLQSENQSNHTSYNFTLGNGDPARELGGYFNIETIVHSYHACQISVVCLMFLR